MKPKTIHTVYPLLVPQSLSSFSESFIKSNALNNVQSFNQAARPQNWGNPPIGPRKPLLWH